MLDLTMQSPGNFSSIIQMQPRRPSGVPGVAVRQWKACDELIDTGVGLIPRGVDLVNGPTGRVSKTCCVAPQVGLEAALLSNHSARRDEIVENLS